MAQNDPTFGFYEDDQDGARRYYLYHRRRMGVFHDIDDIARSRVAAYRFLNDNRDALLIPAHQDVIVADLYDANKFTRQGRRPERA